MRTMRKPHPAQAVYLSFLPFQARGGGDDPLSDIKVSKDCYIPKENIKLYVSYDSYVTRSDVRRKRKEGLVYDYTNGRKTLAVIYLKDGTLVLTNIAIGTLNQRMDRD